MYMFLQLTQGIDFYKPFIEWDSLLIGVEGAQTPAGGRDREDTTGRRPEEAHRLPFG